MAVAIYLKEKYPAGGQVYIIGEPGLVKLHWKKMDFISAEEELPGSGRRDGPADQFCQTAHAPPFLFTGASLSTAPIRTALPHSRRTDPRGRIDPRRTGNRNRRDTRLLPENPAPPSTSLPWSGLGTAPAETLAVGDRFETDIVGGQRAGLKTALVLLRCCNQRRIWRMAILTVDLIFR